MSKDGMSKDVAYARNTESGCNFLVLVASLKELRRGMCMLNTSAHIVRSLLFVTCPLHFEPFSVHLIPHSHQLN